MVNHAQTIANVFLLSFEVETSIKEGLAQGLRQYLFRH